MSPRPDASRAADAVDPATNYLHSTPIPDEDAARLLTDQPHLQTTGWEAMLVRHVRALEARLRDAERLYPALRHVYETRDSDTWATATILDFLLLHDPATATLYPDYAAWLRAAPRGADAP